MKQELVLQLGNIMKESGGMYMPNRLIIDGNSVYEIDEECAGIRIEPVSASETKEEPSDREVEKNA